MTTCYRSDWCRAFCSASRGIGQTDSPELDFAYTGRRFQQLYRDGVALFESARRHGYEGVLCGAAPGVDQVLGRAALKAGLALVLVRPQSR